jgi:hypothetical protein
MPTATAPFFNAPFQVSLSVIPPVFDTVVRPLFGGMKMAHAQFFYLPSTATQVALKEYKGGQLATTSTVNLANSLGLRAQGDFDGSPERIKTLVTGPLATSVKDLASQLSHMGPDGAQDPGVVGCSTSGRGLFVGASGTRGDQYILVPSYQVSTLSELETSVMALTPLEIWVSDQPWNFLCPAQKRLKYIATRTATAAVAYATSTGSSPLGLQRFLDLMNYPVAVTFDGQTYANQYVRFGVSSSTITQLVFGGDLAAVQTKYEAIRTSGDFDIPVPTKCIPGIVVNFLSSAPVTRTLKIERFQPFGISTDVVLSITLS